MSVTSETFAKLDLAKGIRPLPEKHGDEMPLPAWYRSVYHTPIDQLTIEDLSKAARQQLHVEQIVPLVIERLREEPLAGEMFDGELLTSLSSVVTSYWTTHRSDAAALKAIIDAAWSSLPEDVQVDAKEIIRLIN